MVRSFRLSSVVAVFVFSASSSIVDRRCLHHIAFISSTDDKITNFIVNKKNGNFKYFERLNADDKRNYDVIFFRAQTH